MKIVVIGGSGLVGSTVVARLREHGHEAIPASLGTGVNTVTGEGLADVVTGASVVIDVSNSPCSRPPGTCGVGGWSLSDGEDGDARLGELDGGTEPGAAGSDDQDRGGQSVLGCGHGVSVRRRSASRGFAHRTGRTRDS